MTYVIRRRPDGILDLYKYDCWEPEPKPVAPVIEAPFADIPSMQTIALCMLLDWMDGEQDAECKAVALSVGLGVRLAKLGAVRQTLFTNGKTGWDLTSDELGQMVTELLVSAGESVVACEPTERQARIIEHIGQRRDTVRQAAFQETTPRRLMN